MPEPFLQLHRADRAEILNTASARIGRTAEVLEKDIWVCWALHELFMMPDRPEMVFKGGTSLSKAYSVIKRFSEDIDITIDYKEVESEIDPFAEATSRAKIDRFRGEAQEYVSQFARHRLLPYFEGRLSHAYRDEPVSVMLEGEEEEKLLIHYPSALNTAAGYIERRILIELGARNLTEPNQTHEIHCDITLDGQIAELQFPTATVPVLAAERTFWEKVTLAHAEVKRAYVDARPGRQNYSRHWYDLAMLYESGIAQQATYNRELLEDVIRVKSKLFRVGGVDYTECVEGKVQLVPESKLLQALGKDYQQMIASAMFYEPPPSFDALMAKVDELQRHINARYAAAG